MAILAQEDRFYTHAEYFTFEEQSEEKNEYRRGRIYRNVNWEE